MGDVAAAHRTALLSAPIERPVGDLEIVRLTEKAPTTAESVLPSGPGFFKVCAMQSHELLREVFQKCSPKMVAAELGLSLSMIYKWAEPDEGSGSGTTNPLDRIESLFRCTSDHRLIQWICQRAGGFFILNPKTNKPHPSFLIPATNEIVQEFADLLAVIATAAADNQISPKEAASIRERWEDLKSVTEGFVACCEEGNFSALKDKPPGLSSSQ
jgi:Phage regulatory protein CII (CP76)